MDLLEQTESAIQTFYQCQNPAERNAAHQWLLELQTSTEGWRISWVLLDNQKPVEVQYYGASILYFKIAHHIQDVNEDQLKELKSKFLQLLSVFCQGQKLVLSKLCTGYSLLLIQAANESFVLLKCLEEVENYLNSAGFEPKFIILELLTTLPSEFKSICLSSNQKIVARNFMHNFMSTLLSMTKHILQLESSEQVNIKYQIDTLNCLLVWIEFGVSVADAAELLPILFTKLPCDKLLDKVCEVIIEFITAPTSYTSQNTIYNVLQMILQLQPLVEKAITEENHDFINNLCLLFTNIGETHCRLFLNATVESTQINMLNLVRFILKFTSMKGFYPVDETCSEFTFNFWYTLQDDLYSLDIDEITEYQKQFTNAYVMLIDIFFNKCQYAPENVYAKFSADEKEMFRCYRIDVQDTMLYVYTLLQEKCLTYFSEKLNDLLSDQSSTWQQYEAVLHLLRGVTESIDTDESTHMPSILSLLAKLPNHPKILDSLVLFLGALSEWLNSHPQQIVNVLPFLLQGIMNSETAISCSISLKDICHECSMLLNEAAIMEILQTCYKGLQSQNTPLKVVVRLFEIGGYVISALPVAQMNSQLQVLIAPLFQWFKTAIQQGSVTTKSKKKVIHYLNCYHGLFRALDPFEELPVHPIVNIYGQLIPLFRFLKPWCSFEEVTIAATGCINKALEIAREKLHGHVHVTSEVLADFFTAQPFGCVLDASSTLICMFGAEEGCTARVKNLFSLLTLTCVSMIENAEGKNHPDCMQSFMDLLTRVIKTVPEFLYNDHEIRAMVLKCALELLNYQETPTIKSTCNFLITFINFSNSYDNGKKMIQTVGRDVLVQSLLCIGGVSPRHTTDNFADIILALNKNYVTLLAVWLNEVFSTEGFPTVNASPLQKEHFQKAVLREKSNKRRMKDVVRDFSLICRGLHGMAYAH